MFKYEKNNEKVGAYLRKLIEEKYPSQRQFCKAYLNATDVEASDEELRKMSNRLSQIIKGKKAIQTYDLPYFTELLGVSCEEILSCGKSFVPISGHITNYEVAFSKDKNVWKEYSERPDKLILNPDEYNKTVIDYAIEFKNYAFIKYLMEKGDIWFVDNSKNDCLDRVFGFAANTNIKRRDLSSVDIALNMQLCRCEEQGLRQRVIAMAMENEDFSVLDSLKAREIPALYQLCAYGINARTNSHDYYNDDVTEAIAQSNDKILAYFCDEFQITDVQGGKHSFIYPFLNEVIEKLVEDKNKYAEAVIRKAIEHNENVFDSLSSMINDTAKQVQDNYPKFSADIVKQETMKYFNFIAPDGFVACLFSRPRQGYDKFYSNVVRTKAVSDDLLIGSLIKELNRLFEAIQNIEPVASAKKEEE